MKRVKLISIFVILSFSILYYIETDTSKDSQSVKSITIDISNTAKSKLGSTKKSTKVPNNPSLAKNDKNEEKFKKPIKIKPYSVIKSDLKNTELSDENITDSLNEDSLESAWHSSNENQSEKSFPYKEDMPVERLYVKFNRSAIDKLTIGSKLPIFIPQVDVNYTGEVTKIINNNSQSKSYFGKLKYYDAVYQFVLTQGPTTSYGSFLTPDGKYALEANGSDAWVHNVADRMKQIDYSKSDTNLVK